MILFECDGDNGEIRRAVFAGNMDTLIAEIMAEISFVYGTIARQDENIAKEFARKFTIGLLKDGPELVFSTKLADALIENGDHETNCIVIDNKEFMKQMEELRNENQ